MSDYSGPYGREHDPSEMTARGRRKETERRAEDADRDERAAAPKGGRPGDEGEGEETGEDQPPPVPAGPPAVTSPGAPPPPRTP
ncbi:MAG TPA: hypothetical protein VE546_03645 [Streptomyces sp.]|uniref:hypothetical protein n=1 Tax=Streptomyces sp. TaxID=1931 RepID=UPI002D3AFB3B|nr:hypothetical protein [Streptomyces sp.]HZG02668.1 hypothetical protein [Streptomyces sp.]